MTDYRKDQKVVALVKLEDKGQDFLELDVLENGVILGESPMFREGILTMIGIGTLNGTEYFDVDNISKIQPSYFEDYDMYVYFKNSNESTPVPWEAKTLKYKVTAIEKAKDPNRFINVKK